MVSVFNLNIMSELKKEKTMEEKRIDAYNAISPLLDGLSASSIDVLFAELKTLISNCPVDSSVNPFN